MATGLFFVIAGLLVLFYPQILVLVISGFLIMVGLGIMAASWKFRRMRKQFESPVANWIVRF